MNFPPPWWPTDEEVHLRSLGTVVLAEVKRVRSDSPCTLAASLVTGLDRKRRRAMRFKELLAARRAARGSEPFRSSLVG